MCNKEENHEGGDKKHETLMDSREQGGIFTGKVGRFFQRRIESQAKYLGRITQPVKTLRN